MASSDFFSGFNWILNGIKVGILAVVIINFWEFLFFAFSAGIFNISLLIL